MQPFKLFIREPVLNRFYVIDQLAWEFRRWIGSIVFDQMRSELFVLLGQDFRI